MSVDRYKVGDRVVIGWLADRDRDRDEIEQGIERAAGLIRGVWEGEVFCEDQGPVTITTALVRDHGLHACPTIATLDAFVIRVTKASFITSAGPRFRREWPHAHMGPGRHDRRVLVMHANPGMLCLRAPVATDAASRSVLADALEAAGACQAAAQVRAEVTWR